MLRAAATSALAVVIAACGGGGGGSDPLFNDLNALTAGGSSFSQVAIDGRNVLSEGCGITFAVSRQDFRNFARQFGLTVVTDEPEMIRATGPGGAELAVLRTAGLFVVVEREGGFGIIEVILPSPDGGRRWGQLEFIGDSSVLFGAEFHNPLISSEADFDDECPELPGASKPEAAINGTWFGEHSVFNLPARQAAGTVGGLSCAPGPDGPECSFDDQPDVVYAVEKRPGSTAAWRGTSLDQTRSFAAAMSPDGEFLAATRCLEPVSTQNQVSARCEFFALNPVLE